MNSIMQINAANLHIQIDEMDKFHERQTIEPHLSRDR